jgi:hypothetical protein
MKQARSPSAIKLYLSFYSLFPIPYSLIPVFLTLHGLSPRKVAA